MTGKNSGSTLPPGALDLEDLAGPAWRGWWIHGDRLCYGRDARPSMQCSELGYFDWMRWQVRDYQRELAQAHAVGISTGQREALREVLDAVRACRTATERAEALLGSVVAWRAAATPGAAVRR